MMATDETITGTILTTLNQANQQATTEMNSTNNVAQTAAPETGPNSWSSVASATAVMGNPPRKIIQAIVMPAGMVQTMRLCTTVPAPQVIAEISIKMVPSGDSART